MSNAILDFAGLYGKLGKKKDEGGAEPMNLYTIVNIICGALGICVLFFGALVAGGTIGTVPQNKAVVIFFLGAIIIVWALISQRRHGR